MLIATQPKDDLCNGWSAILPKRTPHAALTTRARVQWLVIGAGFAGLAAARRLAQRRPHDRIIVLEAGRAGENASGRNSGFAIDIPHVVDSSDAELRQAAVHRRLLAAGMTSLEGTIAQFGIECAWSRVGKYHCAASARLERAVLEGYAHELERLGEVYEPLDADELASRLGTPFFRAGIHTLGGALVNPAALTRGLADTLPSNVTVHENSPVLEFQRGIPARARTPSGEVVADQVILANNGLATQFGAFRQRMFSVASYGSLTAPLSIEQRARVGNVRQWGVTPANAVAGATMRYTSDHRILIRQCFDFTPAVTTSAARRAKVLAIHLDSLRRRFPALHDLQIEHFWSGHFSMTRNGAPAWGKVDGNLYSASGCNGVGIVKQTIAGSLLADYATGTDHSLVGDMMSLGAPSWLPPRPFLDLAVSWRLGRERWLDRAEI